jgi:hypothetical protein
LGKVNTFSAVFFNKFFGDFEIKMGEDDGDLNPLPLTVGIGINTEAVDEKLCPYKIPEITQ